MNHRILSLALAILASTTQSSCILNANSRTKVTGRYVSAETLRQIEPGKTQEYVIALLGDPTTRTKLADGVEIWKWQYTENRSSSGSFIFVFDSSESRETTNATYVEFKDVLVTKAWRD